MNNSGPDYQDLKALKDRIVAIILDQIQDRHQVDIREDEVAMDRILEAAQRAAEQIREQGSSSIRLPYLIVRETGPVHFNLELSGEDLKSLPEIDSFDQKPKPTESTQRQVQVQLPDRKPVLTYVIFGLTVLIYLIQVFSGLLFGTDLPSVYGLKVNELIVQGEYWRLLTPMLLHGSLLHIGFNMYALYILGRRIERLFGPVRFLLVYIVAGFVGNVFSFFFTQSPSLGSSTAIFGLLGAEGVFIYQHRKIFGKQFNQQLWQIVQVAVVNILIGLSPGIDNWGHIGGLIGGMVFTLLAGPLFKLEGSPPLLTLRDQRDHVRAYLVFAGIGVIISILVRFVIQTRV
jgi:rhomboid protease GluP